ncbi:hypothetical protein [Anaerococcus sp. AGMB09787]|uniref:hypothetical protein n=1 Tax=Anaerococcus sp. AGMB09787 TaxID=2922869 RepID=UPI001FAE8B8D|nr:hypothetical protein [Anaerococcus sp. AGMB09787]
MELEEQFKAIVEEYKSEVRRCTEEAAEDAGQYTLSLVKQRSPRDANRKRSRVGKRRYASGWKIEREDIGGSVGRFVIHNVTDPTLTHLLERGHVMNFDHSKRARAIPHIENSEEDGAKYYEKIVASKLENLS